MRVYWYEGEFWLLWHVFHILLPLATWLMSQQLLVQSVYICATSSFSHSLWRGIYYLISMCVGPTWNLEFLEWFISAMLSLSSTVISNYLVNSTTKQFRGLLVRMLLLFFSYCQQHKYALYLTTLGDYATFNKKTYYKVDISRSPAETASVLPNRLLKHSV